MMDEGECLDVCCIASRVGNDVKRLHSERRLGSGEARLDTKRASISLQASASKSYNASHVIA